jgi:hypothetical protein
MPFAAPASDIQGFSAPAADLDQQPSEPQPEGFWATAGRELATGIAPAIGTAAGGLGAGALAIESGPGAIAADIAGGAAGGAATEALQRKIMGRQWSDENMRQMEANAKAHPHAAMLGSALPFVISALGGGGAFAEKAAQSGAKKGATELLQSATGFSRAGVGTEAAKQVQTGQFSPANLLEEGTKGFVTGGAMHFIPGDLPKFLGGTDGHALTDVAKNALWRVTGKAAGDATTMVAANKYIDHVVHGKPFTMSDVIGDSAASTVDFALLNAIHAGIELKKASAKSAEAGLNKTAAALAEASAPPNVPQKPIAQDETVATEPATTVPPTGEQPAVTAPPPMEGEGSSEENAATPAATEPPVGADRSDQGSPASVDRPHVVAATYTKPEGVVYGEGENHMRAAEQAGVVAPEEREARETPEYGFKIQHPDGRTEVVDRAKALEIARDNGQLKPDAQIERGNLHSDQLTMADEAKWSDVPVEKSNQPAFTSEAEAKETFASKDPDNGGVRDTAKPETFREYLARMICRGYRV